MTAKDREIHLKNWYSYVGPLGVDHTLQDTNFQKGQRLLTGFGGLNRTGYYGKGKNVQGETVSGALTAVGTTIAVARYLEAYCMDEKLDHKVGIYCNLIGPLDQS